ncbi:MAG TPA: SDR family oxidoreductase [Longimicrobiales bacterium]|nr:SDR family oxidoreductase [Longimicrobiales bacterium]
MELQDRIALVTGGAHRVGRALALALARAGCDVAVHYNRSGDDADRTVRDIEALGRRAFPVQADLGDADSAGPLIEESVLALGALDILVNSASLFERAAVADIDVEAWDRVQAVNVRAPFLLSRAAAPHLARRRGSIVNIADLSALQPWPSYAHHAVSKAGLVHLTRVLARALAPEIRVNAIAPGTVLPPEDGNAEEGHQRRLLDVQGSPQDVERALLYLATSPFVTGQVLVVDGGRILL